MTPDQARILRISKRLTYAEAAALGVLSDRTIRDFEAEKIIRPRRIEQYFAALEAAPLSRAHVGRRGPGKRPRTTKGDTNPT